MTFSASGPILRELIKFKNEEEAMGEPGAHRVTLFASIILCATSIAVAQSVWNPHLRVLDMGPSGAWDEMRGAATVLFDGSLYHMWYQGCDSTYSECAIGHATSPDGLATWTLDSNNPVVLPGPPGSWDLYLWSPIVVYDGGQFHMWYSGYDGWERTGYASSSDGSVWNKLPNPVLDVSPGQWDDEVVRPGAVLKEGDLFTMWYTGGSGLLDSLRIGYATSPDGIVWTKRPDWVLGGEIPEAWDEGVCNPAVVFDGTTYHMSFVGIELDWPSSPERRLGYAFSRDGIHWAKFSGNPVFWWAVPEFAGLAPMIYDGSTFHMWFSLGYTGYPETVWYATSTCCAGLFGDGFESSDCTAWSSSVP
jgi:hypothetical protein